MKAVTQKILISDEAIKQSTKTALKSIIKAFVVFYIKCVSYLALKAFSI
jgi:hypothetical protein